MATLNGNAKSSQNDVAYEYLCRLEEAKKWMECVLHENLPPTLELEDALQNGVYLCKLGMVLLPDDELWRKVYDLDQSKFKVKGLDYRYTDNINFWLKSLVKLGLPKVFYPVMTDIFHKKDMPKLIYCLHALSHLMKRRGQTQSAVDDLYGSAQFPHDALVQTGENLKTIKYMDMPAFGIVENLVEEELQYQAMGLCESYDEELSPRSPNLVVKNTEEAKKFFDDPTYVGRVKIIQEIGEQLIEMSCVNPELKIALYARSSPTRQSNSLVEQALSEFNNQLNSENPEDILTAMKSVFKLVDTNYAFLHQSHAARYHQALIKEKKEGIPGSILPVYTGMDRDMCESLLENMSPGAYILRRSNTVEGAYVFSFRNQTGLKHWKLSTKNGKFYWGSSELHSSLDSFVENFVEALSQVTKLHIYYGMSSGLQPVIQTAEEQAVMDTLHQADEDLMYGHMCKVIKDVNFEVRREKKLSQHGEHQPDEISKLNLWDESMIVKVKKIEAEKILNSKGEKGSFLVRPSERTPGDYALAFRTNTDIRHWRIVNKSNKFYVHPRPNPYNSLDDIIAHFQEAVGQETGLTMIPLVSNPSRANESHDNSDQVNGGSTLLRLPSPVSSPGLLGPPLNCGPSVSMSRLNPANLTSWSVDDVCQWLMSVNLGNFMDPFKENEVDGECLMTLDNQLLKDDLGITALGHRSRILKRVEALKNEFHPN